jgi:hypothetical protein
MTNEKNSPTYNEDKIEKEKSPAMDIEKYDETKLASTSRK